MKKSIITLSLLCFAMVALAQNSQQKVKGAHPYKLSENENVAQEFAHWSLTPHIGFNYFDGDFAYEKKHSIGLPSAGLDIEYAFNPVWGLGLAYMFDRYNVIGKPGATNADTLLNGYMHKAGLFVSMDFMGLFYPKAKKKICSIQAIIGGGYAWYKSTIMYHDDYVAGGDATHKKGHTSQYINADGVVGPDYMTKYNGQLYLQAGLNVDFNLNRTLALGIRGAYSYFINDYIDGRGYAGEQAVASKNNDGIVDVTLNMRFKLEAVSKTHVRNVVTMYPNDDLARQPQCVHDTVIIKHDSIIVRETNTLRETTKENDLNNYYVYFEQGKEVIREDGLITIQQVADRLAEDPELYAVVTGYCDNTGSKKLNYELGDKRAANVIEELREEHGITDDHMYSTGLGKLVGRRSKAAYGPNRRAVIRLVDKATFERMKADLEDKKAHRDLEEPKVVEQTQQEQVKTVPLSESARQEKVNQYAKRLHEGIVAEKSTTLSKLARKYYNNTYCWVYIYIANKDRISNPNTITPGTALIIPELTQEEMKITKDQSLVLYNSVRQGK
ncbi:MAG: OmpA family protein [Paludibacteraceae bacterium]|nr:OmpA family protein [Paludibacteraceae bacterium]